MENPLKGKKIGTILLGLVTIAITAVIVGYSLEKGKKWAD